MRRQAVACGLAVCICVYSLAPHTQAAPPTPAASEQRMVLGFEIGPAVGSEQRDVRGGEDARDLAQTNGTLGMMEAVFCQWLLTRTFWLGPRLVSTQWSDDEAWALTAGVGAVGTLRWSTEAQVGPRLVFGVGPAVSLPPAPRAFSIEHEVSPAIGAQLMLGLGVDRRARSGELSWYFDLRAEAQQFRHDHTMTDVRTRETVSETLSLDREAAMLVFGLGWRR